MLKFIFFFSYDHLAMIKAILVTDTIGNVFYSRSVNDFDELNGNLFSGLICSIGQIGKQLFQQNLATIHFGEKEQNSHLVIVTKNFFSEKRVIYFAFFIQGECNNIQLKEISASIFIETKTLLRFENNTDNKDVVDKIDEILRNKYSNLSMCF